MNPTVDLRQLAVRRDAPERLPAGPRRHWLSRYVVPVVLLLGFAAVSLWAARESFLPSQPVTIVPVLVTRAEAQQEGTPLFTAAGWIEPRPTPTFVTALAEGIVEQLFVVEGQEVQPEQEIARLIDADARLALRQAQADLKLQQAELQGAQAALVAAKANLKYPLALEAALAEAEATLAKIRTELANLPFESQAAGARLRLAQQELAGKTAAGGSVSGRMLERAQSEVAVALSALDQLEIRKPRLDEEVQSLTTRRDALAKQLELKTDEVRQVATAQADVAAATARVEQSQANVEIAELRLERMTVYSPVAGRVLDLVARPGSRVMGQDPTGGHDASTIVSLYDPQSLQVRADVRLEDLPRVQSGQEVRIETAAVPEPLVGRVLLATALADIQKNTLQVKIAIELPPPVIKPEMLVQVTFLAPPSAKSAASSDQPRLWIPRDLPAQSDAGAHAWIADQASGVARRKAIKLGRSNNELVEVVEGLNQADKLIAAGREGLEDGDRITITGEDATLGIMRNEDSESTELSETPAHHAGHAP